MKKFLLVIAGILCFATSSVAIESDFKNSLLKVDFAKVGTDSYNIKLYTQKPYQEPIKVIKKSNTSYYLLLPETFHSVPSVSPTGDIKNVEVKLFPYAGQDLNNGYTKITINTAKPVNITAQLNTSQRAVAPVIDTKKLAQIDGSINRQSNQEALLAKQRQEQKIKEEQLRAQKLKEQQEKEAKARLLAQAEAKKKAQLEAQRKAQEAKRLEAQRLAQIEAQRKAQEEAQRLAQKQKELEAQRLAQLEAQKQRELEAQRLAQLEAQKRAEEELKNQTQEPQKTQGIDVTAYEIDPSGNTDYDYKDDGPITYEPEKIEDIGKVSDEEQLSQIINTILPYYKVIRENFILFCASLVAIIGILMLMAISGKSKKQRLKNAGRYLRQDRLKSELEELKNNSQRSQEDIFEQEEIKEETENFAQEFAALAQDEEEVLPKKEEYKEEIIEEPYVEPEILSTAEIAPNRGFSVIDQDGKRALFGFIGNEIFFLYHFREYVSDYTIKYRISEKQETKTFFIVKIDNVKLLVRVTNIDMKLELEM